MVGTILLQCLPPPSLGTEGKFKKIRETNSCMCNALKFFIMFSNFHLAYCWGRYLRIKLIDFGEKWGAINYFWHLTVFIIACISQAPVPYGYALPASIKLSYLEFGSFITAQRRSRSPIYTERSHWHGHCRLVFCEAMIAGFGRYTGRTGRMGGRGDIEHR